MGEGARREERESLIDQCLRLHHQSIRLHEVTVPLAACHTADWYLNSKKMQSSGDNDITALSATNSKKSGKVPTWRA